MTVFGGANEFKQHYAHTRTRALKSAQQHLFDTVLPTVDISDPGTIKVDFFQNRLWIEIGFGGGEHLCQQALQNPDVMFIGCEPFVNGVASLLKLIHHHTLKNVLIYQDDARLLLRTIPNQSCERIFLLFPDPWPKKRHHKRRFIQDDTLVEIHRVLKRGGEWRIATDHADYRQWVIDMFSSPLGRTLFQPIHGDFMDRPDIESWPQTRYEQKAAEAGRASAYFRYRSVSID
ncbi:MAG: tRNA (guanosine(46)-N7)-methyltransferase TrmB [Alphaproteobacteria bacterium]|nr:tRNA (guanosine(46)-N7)-methyltransferase TrmB [Alphaproteobacteria bacterium]